jgi:hypothetical protein
VDKNRVKDPPSKSNKYPKYHTRSEPHFIAYFTVFSVKFRKQTYQLPTTEICPV